MRRKEGRKEQRKEGRKEPVSRETRCAPASFTQQVQCASHRELGWSVQRLESEATRIGSKRRVRKAEPKYEGLGLNRCASFPQQHAISRSKPDGEVEDVSSRGSLVGAEGSETG